MAKSNNLIDFLTNLADKFRSKLGTSNKINPQNFESLIDDTYTKGYNDAPKGIDVSDTTAVKGDVLSDKYFYDASGQRVEGTMVNNGSLGTTNLNASSSSKTIPSGYTSGGTVKIDTTNLSAGNIKKGTSILGVTGTFSNVTATDSVYITGNGGKTLTISGLALGGMEPKIVCINTTNTALSIVGTTHTFLSGWLNLTGLEGIQSRNLGGYSSNVRFFNGNNASVMSWTLNANAITITLNNGYVFKNGEQYYCRCFA